ncbi:hypothetical protein PENTCL1PPCAC_753, partial [Pristionchus entomophagus]
NDDVDVFLSDDSDDIDGVEILEPSTSRGTTRKRKREEEEDDTLCALLAKVRQLESENREVKHERDFFKKRASVLEPSLQTASVHTHEIAEFDGEDYNFNNYRSAPFIVDGVEFTVVIKSGLFENSRSLVPTTVTLAVSLTHDHGPRHVMGYATVRQRYRFEKKTAVAHSTANLLLDNQSEIEGNPAELELTDEFANSKIAIHITAVVQKLEMPGDGGEEDTMIVRVQERDFKVSSAYLSQWSRFFRAHLATSIEEQRNEVYTVKDEDITPDDFQELLLVIYPTQKPISMKNYNSLLTLANRFEMPDLTRRVDSFLLDFDNHNINSAKLFRLATDKFDLPLVQAKLLHRWRDADLLKSELLSSYIYKKLEPVTRNLINQQFADNSLISSSKGRRSRFDDDSPSLYNPFALWDPTNPAPRSRRTVRVRGSRWN